MLHTHIHKGAKCSRASVNGMMGLYCLHYNLHINWELWEMVGLILASFAGLAVSLCVSGAAVQTHAKLTMASTVVLDCGAPFFSPDV